MRRQTLHRAGKRTLTSLSSSTELYCSGLGWFSSRKRRKLHGSPWCKSRLVHKLQTRCRWSWVSRSFRLLRLHLWNEKVLDPVFKRMESSFACWARSLLRGPWRRRDPSALQVAHRSSREVCWASPAPSFARSSRSPGCRGACEWAVFQCTQRHTTCWLG